MLAQVQVESHPFEGAVDICNVNCITGNCGRRSLSWWSATCPTTMKGGSAWQNLTRSSEKLVFRMWCSPSVSGSWLFLHLVFLLLCTEQKRQHLVAICFGSVAGCTAVHREHWCDDIREWETRDAQSSRQSICPSSLGLLPGEYILTTGQW